jgi:uncharacterized membrane protein YfcA
VPETLGMPQEVFLVIMGFFIGALGTFVGLGGGFLMVPIFLWAYHMSLQTAIGTSLAIIFLNAASGTLAYFRQRRIDFHIGAVFAALTIPGAILGAVFSSYFEARSFNIAFGALLMLSAGLTGLKSFWRPPETPCETGRERRLTDSSGETYEYRVPMFTGGVLSIVVGFLSSIFGIGGGVVHVPVMRFILRIPVHVATATSHFILAVSVAFGAATHIHMGHVDGRFALWCGIGAVAGAQVGAMLSKKAKPALIMAVVAIAMTVVGIRLILKGVI